MTWEIRQGDALEQLRTLPGGSVQTCITSPPYFGLRDYGTGEWEGGDEGCDHIKTTQHREQPDRTKGWDGPFRHTSQPLPVAYSDVCGRCGATRTDSQIGLEPTPDEYVASLVEVFREVRRVLRDDGTVWLNLGDSYAGSYGNQGRKPERGTQRPINSEMLTPVLDGRYPSDGTGTGSIPAGVDYKAKDLLGIPWAVAFALRADGWYLRSDIIWAKPNPMPESVTDRPTKAHEYIFLLSKKPTYYYDADAIREEPSPSSFERWGEDPYSKRGRSNGQPTHIQESQGEHTCGVNPAGRNKRTAWYVPEEIWGQFLTWLGSQPSGSIVDMWRVATQPFSGVHFASFPPKLIEPCVLAGSAETACGVCGAPWERVTRLTTEYASQSTRPGLQELDREEFRNYLVERRSVLGLTHAEVDRRMGTNGAVRWWEGRNRYGAFEQLVPSWDLYRRLKGVLGLDERFDDAMRRQDQNSNFRYRTERIGEKGPTDEGETPEGRLNVIQSHTIGWQPSCAHSDDTGSSVVLDPFAGAGTTGLVAVRHNRSFIGIELSPDYAEMARDRIRDDEPLWNWASEAGAT